MIDHAEPPVAVFASHLYLSLVTMVQVEEKESGNSHGAPASLPSAPAPAAASPPQPPAAAQQAQPSASAVLAQCLKLLRGKSDEHKFAGLVMVTKHVPALTSSGSSGSSGTDSDASPSSSIRQICNAVGPSFVHRLLRTPGDKMGGEGEGGAAGGLSVYQQIALGVLAAFFRDESLVQKFLPVAPALVRALRAADAATQTQGLCDALYCAQALAVVPGGVERLLRAGAAPAVVSRLSAASGDRVAERAARLGREASGGEGIGGESGEGGGGVEETKTAGAGGVEETKTAGAGETKEESTTAATAAENFLRPSPKGFGAGSPETARTGGGDRVDAGRGDAGEQAGPAERAEALAFAFVGRALEASGGNCLGSRELTSVAEAFRDDPTSAKFDFMDLLLRWASLQEEGGGAPHSSGPAAAAAAGGEEGVGVWTRRGPFPAALREGLLQALHGAAEDERRDSAIALLASLLRALGQEWAVEEEDEVSGGGVREGGAGARSGGGGGGGGGIGIGAKTSGKAKAAGTAPKRKRGTFVAFTVRCAAGEVRILLDEALSLLVPAAARGGAGSSPNGGGGGDDDEAGPGTGRRARGAMGPAGVDPSIGVAAELAAAAAAASTADASKGGGDGQSGGDETVPPPAERTPLTSAQLRTMKDQRVGRLLRMVPVSLGVAESTIAFLCGGGEEAEEDESGEDAEEDGGRNRQCRWDELPIGTLQDLQKTLVGLFGCVLDFFSEIRRWIVVSSPTSRGTGGGGGGGGGGQGVGAGDGKGAGGERNFSAAGPSIVDLWVMQKLGLQCSRVLGVWVAEDSESLPQRFLEALPVLLALKAGEEAPDSDDEESDEEEEEEEGGGPNATAAVALQAFPGAARYIAAVDASNSSSTPTDPAASASTSAAAAAARADEALHNVLRAMLALSYEAAPLAAMVEEGVTARLARLAAAAPPAIAALLGRREGLGVEDGGGGGAPSGPPPPEQVAEAVRSPLITACGLLTNILTSAGHLAWPEGEKAAPSHPVLGHPGMGECLASLAEVAGEAGAARRSGGGARWRLVVAHATLVVMVVARAAAPGNGLAPARGLADREPRRRRRRRPGGNGTAARSGARGGPSASEPPGTVWDGMATAVDEALGSLSLAPGRGLIGGGGRDEDEEASYEEGSIWQWCLECAREMEAASGGAAGNPYVSAGVVPRRVLKSLMEASSDGRI